jgi:hypothetical protein
LILQALRKCGWNRTRAAAELDISRKTLCYRIAKYGIEREDSAAGLEDEDDEPADDVEIPPDEKSGFAKA